MVAFLVFLVPAVLLLRAIGRPDQGARGQSAAVGQATKATLAYSTLTTEANSENAEIYVRSEDGSTAKITSYEGPDFAPSLSADGLRIAFVSDRDDPGNMDIYIMDVDGTNVMRATTDPEIDARPTWAPDGREIAFARAAGSTFEIWVAALEDKSERQLTANDVDDFAPAWSPDGKTIAFQRYVDTNLELFAIAPDGSGETQLTNLPGQDRDPVWSPDGKTIAFVRDADETRHGVVYILPVGTSPIESGQASPLTADTALSMNDPVWSADGSWVAFVSLSEEGYSVDGRLVGGGQATSAGLPDALVQELRNGYRLLGIDGTA